MKRKRQLNPLFDWGQIPTVKVVDQPRETLKSFTEKYNADEEAKRQDKLNAPFRQAQAELHAETREISRRVKAFYSQNLSEMGSFPLNSVPVDTVAILAGNFPTRHAPRDHSDEGDIYREFRKGIEAQGISLSEDGYRRLGSWVSVQVAKGEVVPSTELWQCGLDRLTDLACFKPGESNYAAPTPAQPVAQQPETSAERLVSTDPQWKKIVNLGFSDLFSKWFLAWIESLKKNFNYDFPVDELGMKCARFLERWNLSPFVHASWDSARKSFVASGDMPDTLLTSQDRLCALLEASNTNDYHVRRELGRQAQELINMSADRLPRHK
jgi:hypothetical protein